MRVIVRICIALKQACRKVYGPGGIFLSCLPGKAEHVGA